MQSDRPKGWIPLFGELSIPFLVVAQVLTAPLMQGCSIPAMPVQAAAAAPPSPSSEWMSELTDILRDVEIVGAPVAGKPIVPLPQFKTKEEFLAAFRARMGMSWDEWVKATQQQLAASEKPPEIPPLDDREFIELIRTKRAEFERFTDEQKKVVTAAEEAVKAFKDQQAQVTTLLTQLYPLAAEFRSEVAGIIEHVNKLDELTGEAASKHVELLLSDDGPIAKVRTAVMERRELMNKKAQEIQTSITRLKELEDAMQKALDALKKVFPETAPTVEKLKEQSSDVMKTVVTAAAILFNPLLALLLLFMLGCGGGGGGNGGEKGNGQQTKNGDQTSGNTENGTGTNSGDQVGSGPNKSGIPEDAKAEPGIKGIEKGPWLVTPYVRNDERFFKVSRESDPDGQKADLKFSVEKYGPAFAAIVESINAKSLVIESVASDGEVMAPMTLTMKCGNKEFRVKWRSLDAIPVVVGGDSPDPIEKTDTPLPIDVSETAGPHRWSPTVDKDGNHFITLFIQGKRENAVRLKFPTEQLGINEQRLKNAQWRLESIVQIGDKLENPWPIEIRISVGDKAATHTLLWKANGEVPLITGQPVIAAK